MGFSVLDKRLAGKIVSKITHFFEWGLVKNLNPINSYIWGTVAQIPCPPTGTSGHTTVRLSETV